MSEALVERGHGPGCSCERCRGFQQGNAHAVRHGAYSKLRLAPRAEQLAGELVELVPFVSEADGPMLDLLSITLAQVERAQLVLAVKQANLASGPVADGPREERGTERHDRLAADLRGWIGTSMRLCDALGLTPTSRARLAGDLAHATAEAALANLRAEGGEIRARRLGVVEEST
jgi:hypothetical protein